MFPEVHFTLLDATRKKVDCVREFAESLGLNNVTAQWGEGRGYALCEHERREKTQQKWYRIYGLNSDDEYSLRSHRHTSHSIYR